MKKLPPRPITQLPTPQREHLSAWLHEWEVELQLRKMDDDASLEQLPEGAMNGTPLDEPVCVGEIRLLAPHLLPPGQRPVYVLVVSKWDNDWKLVTPFSQFPLPATQGELLTLRSEGPWQVLQVWNSRTLPNEVIAESWVADTASESLLDEAWAVFRHVTFSAELPDELSSRIGPPVLQPHDPRIKYQEMEMALLSGLAREAFKAAELLVEKENTFESPSRQQIETSPIVKPTGRRLCYMPSSLSELALAASGEISPTAVEVLLVGEAGRIELFEQMGQPGFYRARVISDPLKELDGAVIISGEDQTPLVQLMAAAGTATFNGTCGILVRLADGRVMTPQKEAE
jgi:hypothetical protein